MGRMKLCNDDKHYLARIYAKAAHMENTSDGMEESEYWCGMRVGIRKVVDEVFWCSISARPCFKDGKLIKYFVYFNYELVEVAAGDIGVVCDAR